ncbi:MAG: S-adenosylmethionine:tRNA ribosyltransferase-isomerase [Chloroflexi bacterium]|nr:S-adenosylmethionine:tRNA ribosyltransferase-isomerase [Chloroflexota bacterium]
MNTTLTSIEPVLNFRLPPELEAHEPPEHRGLRRDQVRLLVLPRFNGEFSHTRFDALSDYLREGDLLVANTSRTLPGLLRATDERGEAIEVRLAHRRTSARWDVLLLEGRTHVGRAGMRLDFGQGLSAHILRRRPDLPFLWQMEFDRCCTPLLDLIYRLGEPVRYTYVPQALPLDLYQTVYAGEPGSVEMPSAGRPFTWELLLKLRRKGVGFATLALHTGLSSTRDDVVDALHPNYDEEYHVPQITARAVNAARQQGGRVIAVGTTVVRALESLARSDGAVAAARGWTRLHIAPHHQLRVVDGLVTGLHEPHASHLDLLSAFVEPARLQAAYQAAIERRYLWHEFGDMNLII